MFKLAPSTLSASEAVEQPYDDDDEEESEEEEEETSEVEKEQCSSAPQQSTSATTTAAADKKPQLESLPIWEDYMPDLSKEIKDLKRILAQAVELGSLNNNKKNRKSKKKKLTAAAAAAAVKKNKKLHPRYRPKKYKNLLL